MHTTTSRKPLRIETTWCGDGYFVKLYRGYSTATPCLETGIAQGPQNPGTLRAALRDLHKRWTAR